MFKVKAHQRNIVNTLSESFQSTLSFLLRSSSLKHLLLQLLLEIHDLLGQVVLLCLPIIGKHVHLCHRSCVFFSWRSPGMASLALELGLQAHNLLSWRVHLGDLG